MGRGKDKIIESRDIVNMSPAERRGLGNLARTGRVQIRGAASVRSKQTGNVKYEDPSMKGQYHEDKLS